MIYKCNDCGTIWTMKQTKTRIDPKRVKLQRCVDCSTFDYPNYTKRLEYARSLKLGKKVDAK